MKTTTTLPAVNEVSLIYVRPHIAELPKVTKSTDAAELFRSVYPEGVMDHRELFYTMFLNANNSVLAIAKVSEGSLTATVADVRIVFVMALKLQATALIICHNHPSGQLKASPQDQQLTKRMVEAGKFLDIQILDHLIITSEGYLSFADEGMM